MRIGLLGSLGLVAFFCWTGIRGIDFGHHWDEHQFLSRTARYVSSGVLVQEDYNYPSLGVRLLAAALLPERGPSAGPPAARAEQLREVVSSHAFRLRGRTLFLLLSSLTGVWAFLAAWRLSRDVVWSLLGAGFTLTSWEIAYHARWIAADSLSMQFGSLALLLALVACRSASLLPLAAAAGAAGLACSAKWTGGHVLLGVLLAALFGARRGSPGGTLRTRTLRGFTAVAVFSAVVLLVTPTLYLEPARVVESLREQMRIYGQQGHFGYDTKGFLDHLGLVVDYYAGSALSPWPAGALPLFALACVGGVSVARARPREAAVLLAAPLAFTLYLASQRVMIVRNVLPVLPVLAILAALGGRAVAARSGAAGGRLVALAGLALVGLHGAWLLHASNTIRRAPQVDPLAELVRWADAHPDAELRASVHLARALAARFPERSFAPCASDAPEGALCALLSSEAQGPHRRLWPANRIHYRLLPSGPYEVNWDYYPTWEGPERVVLVAMEDVLGTSLREVVGRAW